MWLIYMHIRIENVIRTYFYNLGETTQERMGIRAKRPGAKRPRANGNKGEMTQGRTGFRAKRPGFLSFLRGAVVEWLEWLGYGAESRRKVASSALGFAIRRLEICLFQPSSKWVPFFESGKDKAAKGEGWVPPFICCAHGTVGL